MRERRLGEANSPMTTKPELAEPGLELTELIYFWVVLGQSLTKGHLYSKSPNFFTLQCPLHLTQGRADDKMENWARFKDL